MKDKIFEETKDATMEELVKKINEVIREKLSILDEENDIEKFNTIPKLLLLEDKKKQKLLSFVEFVDSLLIPLEEKAMYIISLSGLIEFTNIALEDYDDASLFTMADYYQNSSIDDIKNTLAIIRNKELLLAVRKKTLDLEVRKKILQSIVNRVKTDQININDKGSLATYIERIIAEINEKDYYDLMK